MALSFETLIFKARTWVTLTFAELTFKALTFVVLDIMRQPSGLTDLITRHAVRWGQVLTFEGIGNAAVMVSRAKGGEAQIEDELRAYSPLVPQGRELVATMMLEVDDPVRRDRLLRQLGGIEEKIAIRIGDDEARAVAEEDVERTTADGKTSSVHFLRFPFTEAQVAAFRDGQVPAVLAIDHPNYGHMAIISPEVRQALAGDFDA